MVYHEKFGERTEGHVILVHGLGEHFKRHEKLIKRLKNKGFRVHAFDWPGHGKSPGKRGHARIEKTIGIIENIAVEIKEKPFLFGHSLGGLTVLRYAEERPNKIKGVISSSPALKRSENLSLMSVKLISLLSYLFPKKTISNSLDIEDVTRGKRARDEYREDELVHDKVSLALLRDLFHHMKTAHDKKDKIKAPLLTMVGTEDKITPPEGAENFMDDLKTGNKKLRRFRGAYHEIFNDPEWEEEFHDEIIDWIEIHS